MKKLVAGLIVKSEAALRTTSRIRWSLTLAAAVFLGQPWLSAAEARDQGELTIYESMTEIGVVAKREFRDPVGRVVKTVYYGSRAGAPGKPRSETELIEHSVIISEYTADGRLSREKHFSPDLTLRRVREVGPAGAPTSSVWRRGDETKSYEIRSDGNRATCHLYFDNTGKNLIAVSGTVPADTDLAAGWGTPAGGLACGLGVSQSQGQLTDILLYVSVRNLAAEPRQLITCLWYHERQVELRDEAGNLVPQDTQYIQKRDRELRHMNRGLNEATQTLAPHEAGTFDGGLSLREWYSNVPSGTYQLTVRRRAAGADYSLVSKPVRIQIVSAHQSTPPPPVGGGAETRPPQP